MKKLFVYLLGAAFLSGFAVPAVAQLTIEITEGVDQALPIAVVPFEWQGGLVRPPLDVSAIIAADLANSGRFDPMDTRDMLERPVDEQGIDFEDWRLLGLETILVGRLLPQSGGNYVIQFELFDLFNQQKLLGFRLSSTSTGLRAAAHRISDLIYEKLTGIKGAFATRIAFITVQGQGPAKRYRLVIADADGSNHNIILESPEPLMSPAWSPDGDRIAYVSFESNKSAIYIQELSTGERIRVSAREGVNGAPAFSPDGRKLALTLSRDPGNLDIYVLNLANQVLTRITRNPAIDTEATWSTDGSKIFFTSDRSGGPQIYKVEIDGGGKRRITYEGNYNGRSRLTPDDKEMAVVHNDQGAFRIARVNPDNGNLLVLTDGQLDESPSFAPNGETIIYATRVDGRGVLATVSIDGRIHRRIAAQEGDVREPAWSPYPDF
ncbi:MAG: Tol-Pal system beta propeller repeat protein TolB [Gammaproteobacteria bacterium]|nr:Tol-Pal system beta propeller repeat protein TolB [Gammaproteobacteria bacterium]